MLNTEPSELGNILAIMCDLGGFGKSCVASKLCDVWGPIASYII